MDRFSFSAATRFLAVTLFSVSAPLFANQCGDANQAACPAVPMTPVASGGQIHGFNGSGLGRLDTSFANMPRAKILSKLSDSGTTLVRTQISWGMYQPQKNGAPNTNYLALIDAEHNDLAARGIGEVMVIMGTPYWALSAEDKGFVSPGKTSNCADPGKGFSTQNCFAPINLNDPAVKQAWQAFVQFVVKRYPDLAGIEIWNEPNNSEFWGNYHTGGANPYQDADRLALMMATAADASHQVAPNLPVIATSMAFNPQPKGNFPDLSYKTWFERLYAAYGAGPSKFDVIGAHLYPCNEGPGRYTGYLNTWLGEYRQIRNRYGDSPKQIWITETGVSGANSAGVCGNIWNEKEQNLALGMTLDFFKAQNAKYGDIPVVLIHNLYNRDSRPVLEHNSDASTGGFGLVAWNKNSVTGASITLDKPAYSTVRCKFKGGC